MAIDFAPETMRASLWHAREHLGDADLVVAGPAVVHGAITGPFTPAAGFAALRSLFAEHQRRSMAFVVVVQQLPQDIAAAAVPDALRAALPESTLPAMHHAEAAITALGLELRDERGDTVSGATVMISEWRLFEVLQLEPEAQAEAEAEAERQGIPTSGYIMIVTGVRLAAVGAADTST